VDSVGNRGRYRQPSRAFSLGADGRPDRHHHCADESLIGKGAGLSLVHHRTDEAHRRVIYRRPRQSRLHLNLFIKNGERVSLRGAFAAPRIYRVAAHRQENASVRFNQCEAL